MFVGDDPAEWVVEHAGRDRLTTGQGVLVLTEPAGWIHTKRTTWGNFRLHFEAQTRPASARALVAMFGEEPTSAASVGAFALPLMSRDAPSAKRIGKRPLMFFEPDRAVLPGAAGQAPDWQTYEVVRSSRTLTATLNGHEVVHATVPRAQDGWIGFLTDKGSLALRNIQVTRVVPAAAVTPPQGTYRVGAEVTTPRPITIPKPRYTAKAMQARIQGRVQVECIVRPSGECSDIEVIKSLDPVFGLDDEAAKSVRLWRFEPGTRSGQPVSVLVVIEVQFFLR